MSIHITPTAARRLKAALLAQVSCPVTTLILQEQAQRATAIRLEMRYQI